MLLQRETVNVVEEKNPLRKVWKVIQSLFGVIDNTERASERERVREREKEVGVLWEELEGNNESSVGAVFEREIETEKWLRNQT